jgi:uncharacterized metal-binding protein
MDNIRRFLDELKKSISKSYYYDENRIEEKKNKGFITVWFFKKAVIRVRRLKKSVRIEEIIMFAQKCNYHKLGIAFCTGLEHEARLLTRILENNDFEVVSVRCKVGAVPKEEIGIRPEEKIAGPEKWESMCNPISQAMILNAENVDLAIMLGLCIGHDTLFIKYCQRPVTVLAVKDRVTGHNPLAALYLSSSYYRRLMKKE